MNYGGFWVRLMAHNIDLIILLPVYYLIGLLIGSNQLLFWVCASITLLYEIIFTAGNWQGTPGKKIMHLQVVDNNQKRISATKSALRTASKAITILTLFIGYAMIVLHPRKKGLHDLLAGTTVILKKGFDF